MSFASQMERQRAGHNVKVVSGCPKISQRGKYDLYNKVLPGKRADSVNI